MHPLLRDLAGGDARGLGRSANVVAKVLADGRLFPVLMRGLESADPLVRMRAADAAEKITLVRPELLQPYKRKFLRMISTADRKEIRWHLAQTVPRLDLTKAERESAFRAIEGYLADSSSIVRTFAMQALVDLAGAFPALMKDAARHVRELIVTGTPAMRARGRKLLDKLPPT